MMESRAVARSPLQAKRGTKQTCKNEACGSRFYDLSRVPSTCPHCGGSYETPAVVRIEFDTLGKQRPRKSNRWVEPSKPPKEIAKVEVDEVDEQVEKEAELPSTAEDLLIEIEDDDDGEAPVAIERETS